MKLIKLTNKYGYSGNNTYWGVGSINSIYGICRKPKLCTNGVFHLYESMELALLINPIFGGIENPKVFEVEAKIEVKDDLRIGTYETKTIRELEIPKWYQNKKKLREIQIKLAISCAETVLPIVGDGWPQKALAAAKEFTTSSVCDFNPDEEYSYLANKTASANLCYEVYNATMAIAIATDIAFISDTSIDISCDAANAAYCAASAYKDKSINLYEIAKKAVKEISQ